MLNFRKAFVALPSAMVLVTNCCAAADAPKDEAGFFLRQLIENSAAPLAAEGAGCLTEGKNGNIGKEIAAVLNSYADTKAIMGLHAKCEKESAESDFCTLSFSVTEGEDQASAGFTFNASNRDHGIWMNTLKCFQTP
jgi:hypothetical protein